MSKEKIKIQYCIIVRFPAYDLELLKHLREFYIETLYDETITYYRVCENMILKEATEEAKNQKEYIRKFDKKYLGFRGETNVYIGIIATYNKQINFKIIEEII